MSSFNKVIIMGNLTRTPELRSTPGGTHLTDITLAINEKWQDKENTTQERVTFVDVTFFGKQAETLCRWKKQGDTLLVEGRLQQDKWKDKKTGENRSKLKVSGASMTFLARGVDDGATAEAPEGRKASRPTSAPTSEGYDDYATSLPEEPRF